MCKRGRARLKKTCDEVIKVELTHIGLVLDMAKIGVFVGAELRL